MPTDPLAIEGRLLVQQLPVHCNKVKPATCIVHMINPKPVFFDRMVFVVPRTIFTISKSIFSPNLTF